MVENEIKWNIFLTEYCITLAVIKKKKKISSILRSPVVTL